ncbi:MAG: trypsin-like peptidase domain-containing protein [Candidatus Levybacteria bacterium]|nr:trypsin-like peptidase domain-containing protein [Candidatus Levybacteria bacterium]
MRNLGIVVLILFGVLIIWEGASRFIPALTSPSQSLPQVEKEIQVTREQNLVIDVVKNVGPSVVTIGVEQRDKRQSLRVGPFSVLFEGQELGKEEDQERLIGSGFIVSVEGLVVTNKHVVSDRDVKYIVVDSKGTKYNVERIYRDPLNDIAILKVANPSAERFREVKLGNSDNLEVGQFAIAIGTALGEFRNTVTTGVISGLGRGITAGNPFEGFVERLDNVIQTDAAINPGNSGGPLLNSVGEVVGVNVAVASAGQNIGFAIPINVVKESIQNFNSTGQFNRAFLGVSYMMISKRVAALNELPQGAFVRGLLEGSPAQKAGLETSDIITKIDGENVTEDNNLAVIINKKKVGQEVTLTVSRDNKTIEIKATLEAAPNN